MMKNNSLFLSVLAIFFIAYWGQMFYGRISLEQSQERIISNYNKHLKNAQAIYQDIRSCTWDYIALTESSLDSLEIIQEKYRNLLFKDSLMLSSELAILKGQTQSMLSLHLEQIEHEYTNITIWADVLGVLFLVFSFYSLTRFEDCIKRGREGVQMLEELENKGKKIIKKIDTAKEDMDAKSSEIVSAFSNNLNKLQSSFEEEINSKLKILDECIRKVQEVIVENEKQSNNQGGQNG